MPLQAGHLSSQRLLSWGRKHLSSCAASRWRCVGGRGSLRLRDHRHIRSGAILAVMRLVNRDVCSDRGVGIGEKSRHVPPGVPCGNAIRLEPTKQRDLTQGSREDEPRGYRARQSGTRLSPDVRRFAPSEY